MHAFIVRPFGIKNGIDFDRVEKELIRPALEASEVFGRHHRSSSSSRATSAPICSSSC